MLHVVLDISRAAYGTERTLFDRARHKYGDDTPLIFLGYDHHRRALPPNAVLRVLTSQEFTAIAEELAAYLSELVESDLTVSAVDVYSFHRVVFGLAPRFVAARVPIRFLAFGALRPGAPLEARPMATAAWPENFMSVQDAALLLKRALQQFRRYETNPIRQSQLRTLLASVDARFNESNPSAKSPGLLSKLTAEAERRGLVFLRRNPGDTANPLVWVSEVADEEPEISVGLSNATSSAEPTITDDASRSDQFLAILKQRDLGPFSLIREALYDALDDVVREGGTAFEIIVSTVETTRKRVGLHPVGAKAAYPWRYVQIFLQNLLELSPVLQDRDGKPFRPSWESLEVEVGSLVENWRLKLDAELVLAIVEHDGAVTTSDLQPLTGALYNIRHRSKQKQIQQIIKHLHDTGVIEVVGTRLQKRSNDGGGLTLV